MMSLEPLPVTETAAERRERARRLQAREPDALAELFDECFERVHGYVRGLVASDHLAEDITQEILLTVYQNLPTYDPRREIMPWVRVIATNKVRDHWRSRRHSESLRQIDLDASDAEWIPADQERPETRLEREDLFRRVRQAVDRLPWLLRETVSLRAFDGLSFSAIAGRLGRNEVTVRKRYSRGLAALRECMDGDPTLQLLSA